MILCSLWTTRFYTFILYRLCTFPLPSFPTSLLSPFLKVIKKKTKKNPAGTSHKTVFQMKTSVCRDGTLKNQPNKMGTTPQHIHTISTSCAILPTCYAHQTTCLFTPTKLTQHSALLTPQLSNPYPPHSAAIKFHNSTTTNISYRSSTAHSFCIQGRLYLPCHWTAATHNR